MVKGKYLLIFLFAATVYSAQAQVDSLQSTDSVAAGLYNSGDWKQLIVFGHKTINEGTDNTDLRLKIAYAYFITGNYKKALKEYSVVLHHDTYNATARYYAYFCERYLNNDIGASYNAGYIDKATLKGWQSPFGLVAASVESGVKINNDANRDNGSYTSAGISNRLGWKLQLDQSFSYFNQGIFKLSNNAPPDIDMGNLYDRQKEYYAKLSFAAGQHLVIFSSYHYINTQFDEATDNNNLGLLGLKYTGTYADIQADVNLGQIDSKQIQQYDTKISWYPFGNFNLYTISSISLKHLGGVNGVIYDQAIGFKFIKNTWLESAVTIGDLDDYLAADGLYVYNAVDKTTFKASETAYYQLGNHAQLQLSYFYEKKSDTYQALTYDQHSVTIGVLWKF